MSWKERFSEIGEKASSRFGNTVSISGNYAVVGTATSEGKAYWYERQNDGKWKEVHSVIGEQAGSLFGNSVSISGNYAIVGAYGYDMDADTVDTGKVYWYERQNDGKWKEVHSVVGEKAVSFLGNSVSISGNYAIVGENWLQTLALVLQLKVKLIGMKDKMMVNGKKSIVLSEKKLVVGLEILYQ